jgi:hypothetical protein
MLKSINDPGMPMELRVCIQEFFPDWEYDNAASISYLESSWYAFAANNTVTPTHPCGSVIEVRNGVAITAELSLGYFQLNSCNFPDWDPWRFFNCRHNVGTAHMLWDERGWAPWYYSATRLGLLNADRTPSDLWLKRAQASEYRPRFL